MELIRATEYAKLKKVSRQTVHSLIKSKTIHTKEFAGMKLIVMDKKAQEWKPEPGKRTDLKVKK